MTAQAARQAESMTRWIAQCGSLVAAVLLGLAFCSDSKHDSAFGPVLTAYTGLFVLMVVGYALAWAPQWEAVGSVIALASVLAAFFVIEGPIHVPYALALLGVGLPAVIHLLACYFHGRLPQAAAST